MTPSMRPVIVPGIRERLPLPLVSLAISSILRVFLGEPDNWFGSDYQSAAAVIVYGALVPMFTVALASGWLRGDATPWAWALARPVSRLRWLGSMLVLDIATLVVCVTTATCVLGTLPTVWLGSFTGGGIREVGYALLLSMVYAAAAFGGAKGASAVGAAMYVAGLSAAFIGVATLANTTELMLVSSMRGYGHGLIDALERAFPLSSRPMAYQELGIMIVLLVMPVAAVSTLLRAASRCPARPSFHSLVAPLLWTLGLTCVLEIGLVLAVFLASLP